MPVPLTQKNLDKIIYWVGTVTHNVEQFIYEFGEYNLALIESNYKRYFVVKYRDPERKSHGTINLTPFGQLRLEKILEMIKEKKRRFRLK